VRTIGSHSLVRSLFRHGLVDYRVGEEPGV
jgi:hypothetical protein